MNHCRVLVNDCNHSITITKCWLGGQGYRDCMWSNVAIIYKDKSIAQKKIVFSVQKRSTLIEVCGKLYMLEARIYWHIFQLDARKLDQIVSTPLSYTQILTNPPPPWLSARKTHIVELVETLAKSQLDQIFRQPTAAFLYILFCMCQWFTAEGSCRLPKRLIKLWFG